MAADPYLEQRPAGTLVRVDLFSHHARFSGFGPAVRALLDEYCEQLTQYERTKVRGRIVMQAKRTFAARTERGDVFGFHINELEHLTRFLGERGLKRRQLWLVPREMYTPPTVTYDWHDERQPRGEQPEMIDYVVNEGRTKVLTLEPGEGKTFIALSAIARLNWRVFFNIKSQYIDKWIDDFHEAMALDEDDIVTIRGSSSFKAMINRALAGELPAKIILCSNMTFFQFLKQFEHYRHHIIDVLGYGCFPWQLYEVLGVGMRVIDEVHQDFHLNYRQDLYTHVPKTLSLSGSLESDDPFVNDRNSVLFPPEIRFYHTPKKPHIKVQAITFRISGADTRIRWLNPQRKTYSHVLYEQSIGRKKKLAKSYFRMIGDIVRTRFVAKRKPNQKMIVFFATKDFCTRATELYEHWFPELKVRRYIGEDELDVVKEGDLIISTLKSLGTAFDVPNLRCLLMTDAVRSQQTTFQCMGRLRKLKEDPDTAPEFFYLVNMSIDKHIDYHWRRVELLKGNVLEHSVFETSYNL